MFSDGMCRLIRRRMTSLPVLSEGVLGRVDTSPCPSGFRGLVAHVYRYPADAELDGDCPAVDAIIKADTAVREGHGTDRMDVIDAPSGCDDAAGEILTAQFAAIPDRLVGDDLPDGLGVAGATTGKAVPLSANLGDGVPVVAVALLRCCVGEVTAHSGRVAFPSQPAHRVVSCHTGMPKMSASRSTSWVVNPRCRPSRRPSAWKLVCQPISSPSCAWAIPCEGAECGCSRR